MRHKVKEKVTKVKEGMARKYECGGEC